MNIRFLQDIDLLLVVYVKGMLVTLIYRLVSLSPDLVDINQSYAFKLQ